ncbi:LysR family transcriptional regulator [Methylocapsa palsarum]|uniref:DNA-binding transcriptional regulator, LysR family n=1 Tax=Methylocapsa palsarum TaxID=1612308 RepID=A0A1I3X0L7_9HYPH|nr:LysR family transcriptional regulator [Methylocapsa palsarum]SFK13110.1 DNA-binding transcriptional regulator, LysR family [Methylocapsa palsarum]
MSIQVRHLNYVIAAEDHGSFRRAAAALGVHESAISRRIRDLEERLGAALFVRSHGGVQLTFAGKQFVDRGRKALSEINLAKTEVAAIGRVGAGELKIGIFSSLGSGFLSGLIRGFAESYPAVQMSFVDGGQSEHVAAIRQHQLDIAFVTGTLEWPGCETEYLWSERVFAALPEQHSLTSSEELEWEDLAGERFIVSEVVPGQEIYNYLVQRLAGLGQSPEILPQSVGRHNLLSLVALGQGLTLASEGITTTQVPGVLYRPMANETLPYSMVWSSQNDNPAFLRLIELARSMAEAAALKTVKTSA